MPLLPRLIAPVLGLAAVLALPACGGGSGGGAGSAAHVSHSPMPFLGGGPQPVACPAAAFFPVDGITVTVPRGYGRLDLTHGHWLEFDPGAVPEGSRYRVTRARTAYAALQFEPVDGAPTRFDGLARLTVNFAACNTPASQAGLGLFRWEQDGTLARVPSARTGQRVSAFLDGFSVYVIATD